MKMQYHRGYDQRFISTLVTCVCVCACVCVRVCVRVRGCKKGNVVLTTAFRFIRAIMPLFQHGPTCSNVTRKDKRHIWQAAVILVSSCGHLVVVVVKMGVLEPINIVIGW